MCRPQKPTQAPPTFTSTPEMCTPPRPPVLRPSDLIVGLGPAPSDACLFQRLQLLRGRLHQVSWSASRRGEEVKRRRCSCLEGSNKPGSTNRRPNRGAETLLHAPMPKSNSPHPCDLNPSPLGGHKTPATPSLGAMDLNMTPSQGTSQARHIQDHRPWRSAS